MVVSTETEVCIGHRLLDYEGPCQHPHGHNYRILVTFENDVTETIPGKGMFVDFKDLKEGLAYILEPFDHAFMLRNDDPLIEFLNAHENKVMICEWNPTAENFAVYLKKELHDSFKGLPMPKVRVWETSKHFVEV